MATKGKWVPIRERIKKDFEEVNPVKANRESIDDITPSEWDAYNMNRIKKIGENVLGKNGDTDPAEVKTLGGKVASNKGSEGYLPTKSIDEHRKEFYESVMASRENDAVNKPAHYNNGNIECIDYIEQQLTEDEYRGYLLGNIIKYTNRHKKKNGVEDLRKENWYLDKLTQKLDKEENNLDPLQE